MKTSLRILLIIFNLLIPYLTLLALLIICFFVYGSGGQGAEVLEKEMPVWTGIYIFCALLHLFMAYGYIQFIGKIQRALLIAVIAAIYLYIVLDYMA